MVKGSLGALSFLLTASSHTTISKENLYLKKQDIHNPQHTANKGH